MNWIAYSALMYFMSITIYLALKALQQKGLSNDLANFSMFFIGWIVFLFILPFSGESLIIAPELILIIFIVTFIFSYIGCKASLDAIKLAENPGYSLVIQKSYAIYTAIVAVFLFDSELSLRSIVAIGIVLFFMAVASIDLKQLKAKTLSIQSIKLSFLAFFLFGNMALASKWLLDQGIGPLVRTFYVFTFISIMFGFDLIRNKAINDTSKALILNKTNFLLFIIMGVSTGLFNLFTQYAFQYAPNIGYVNILNAASIIAITILSALIFKEKLNTQKILGIVGVTVGIILLLLP